MQNSVQFCPYQSIVALEKCDKLTLTGSVYFFFKCKLAKNKETLNLVKYTNLKVYNVYKM